MGSYRLEVCNSMNVLSKVIELTSPSDPFSASTTTDPWPRLASGRPISQGLPTSSQRELVEKRLKIGDKWGVADKFG